MASGANENKINSVEMKSLRSMIGVNIADQIRNEEIFMRALVLKKLLLNEERVAWMVWTC